MRAVDRRRARGASKPGVVVTLAILAVLAVAVWFLVVRPNREAVDANVAHVAHAPATASSKAKPADVSAMSTDQLLAEARKALNEQRLLSPAGNNAFEFYLKVLERQPNNQVAREALRETFPFGANAAEQAINQNNFNEAQREIALLAKADPENYTLTILRSKLDAQRKVVAQQKQQVLTDKAAAAAAAAKQAKEAADAKAAAARLAAAAKASNNANTQGNTASPSTVASVPKAAPKPAPVNIQDAVLLHRVDPHYPTSAIRSREEGWVDVRYTVGVNGNVHHISVTDARPRHVFDRAAMLAVSRWKYKPALRNGKPMAVVLQRRIVFTLGNR